jgi:hypothetical protein
MHGKTLTKANGQTPYISRGKVYMIIVAKQRTQVSSGHVTIHQSKLIKSLKSV